METVISISEVARRSGVASSALRFYEERGLIESERNPAGHRRYNRATARRVAFVQFAQRIGLSLEEIRAELDLLPRDHVAAREDWDRLTTHWRERIEARIRELERLKEGLTNCIGCGCLSLDRCQVMNPDDSAATLGSGPRYWQGDARPFGR